MTIIIINGYLLPIFFYFPSFISFSPFIFLLSLPNSLLQSAFSLSLLVHVFPTLSTLSSLFSHNTHSSSLSFPSPSSYWNQVGNEDNSSSCSFPLPLMSLSLSLNLFFPLIFAVVSSWVRRRRRRRRKEGDQEEESSLESFCSSKCYVVLVFVGTNSKP